MSDFWFYQLLLGLAALVYLGGFMAILAHIRRRYRRREEELHKALEEMKRKLR